MGNAALKQHVVRLLEQHAPLVVKDLPYDELLALSVLGISVTLQRLELQERVLENLGIFLPLEIQSAWLEEVELSLRSGLHLHASAERLVLSVRLRDWDREVEAICQADAKKPWSNTEHAGQPFLLKLVSSFDVEVRNVEILCEMPDAESVPWTFAISTSACVEPLALKQILDPAQCWQAALILKDFRMRVAPSEVARRLAEDERGLVVRLCDEIRIQAHGSKRGGLPLDQTCGRQDAKLCMMLSVSGCAGLRISQQQLGMLFRLGHVFVLWDAFLRSLGTSMISAWMKDLEDLFAIMGQEPLTNAIFILDFGATPVELILEDGHAPDESASWPAALLRLAGNAEDFSTKAVIFVNDDPDLARISVQVSACNFCIELEDAMQRKVCLVDHAGELYTELSAADHWDTAVCPSCLGVARSSGLAACSSGWTPRRR